MSEPDNRGKRNSYLDSIIDKYTATPREDPNFVDYTMRPDKTEIERQRREESETDNCATS